MQIDRIDTLRVDDVVLALMFLTLHYPDHMSGTERAWKTFDWNTLNRCMTQA